MLIRPDYCCSGIPFRPAIQQHDSGARGQIEDQSRVCLVARPASSLADQRSDSLRVNRMCLWITSLLYPAKSLCPMARVPSTDIPLSPVVL